MRDRPKDELVGKQTLAVRLGDARARALIISLLSLAFLSTIIAVVITPWALISLVTLPLHISLVRAITSGASGAGLITLLGKTGGLQLITSLLITLSLSL